MRLKNKAIVSVLVVLGTVGFVYLAKFTYWYFTFDLGKVYR